MRNLIAAVYFLLALFGCDGGGTTIVTRSVANGIDVVHATTRIKAGIARFECIASASGECHYTLFPNRCGASAHCADRPIERFTLPAGETREVIGLPGFTPCVTQDDVAMKQDCTATRDPQQGNY